MADKLPHDSSAPAIRKRRPLRPLAVSAKGVAKLLSCGVRTVRTWDYDGTLPKPVKIGATKKVWIVSELRAWLAAGCPNRAAWEVLKAAQN